MIVKIYYMNLAKNIFAIEGEWENKLDDKLTIKSSLTLLNEVCGIEYVFRKTNTVESLVSYLKISRTARYKKYGVIVIASHGSRYDIALSKGEIIEIEQLANLCKNLFQEKIVHFSSCSVMQNTKAISYFKEISGAKNVCGYTKTIDFLESSLFDIALLQKLYEFERIGNVDNYLNKNYTPLYDQLGFKMI